MKKSLTLVSTVVLLLVSPVFISAQSRRSAPAKRPTAHAPKSLATLDNETFESPSGKIAVAGMHTGIVGILKIHIDSSLKGPVVISVSNNGQIVKQGEGRAQLVELKLSRDTEYTQQVDLADGENVIQVSDLGDSAEKVTLAWRGTGTAKLESVSSTRTVASGDVPSTVTTVPPAPVAVAAPQTTSGTSTSGKLTVKAIYNDLKATVRVDVDPSLGGPFEVKLVNVTSGATVSTKEKDLLRRDPGFTEEVALISGTNQMTVRSKGAGEAAELVTLPPWLAQAPAPQPPVAFAPNDFKESATGNLSASVTRENGNAHTIIHTSEKVRSISVSVVDSDNKPVDSKSFNDIARGLNDWSTNLRAAAGTNQITITAVTDTGTESVVLQLPAHANLKPLETASEDPPEYDWGRVRGYFAGGVIFSKEREDFSKSDIFLDFTLDKNYLGRKHYDVNTFFNARLTSIPVTAKDTTGDSSGSGGGSEDTTPCNTPDCTAFITSKKAAMMQAGIYIPIYADFMTWRREVPRLNRPNRLERNALFIAPLAKGGILTVTGNNQTAEAKQFGADDVFNFFSFGAMLGHFRLHTKETADGWDINPDVAPELISWLTLSAGRWENFEIEVPSGQKNAAGEDILVRRRPWRIEALGRLKIPETPFIIGFDGNFGKGPDDVRFLFGTRFDIGKILHTLRVAAAEDKLGQSTK